ncbi:MAG TPA: MBL fold metallo-hydrolase [Gemmatimonadales bacterium]|nr:MBL fold metallo-hydrolase [Gemmatimonadales bacterium]
MPRPGITFLGAAGTVTGSKHLVDTGASRVLLDCGLFQGLKELRDRNWKQPPVDTGTLDAVVISHAHIDHTGYLPALVKHGYRAPIYCTPATADLLAIMLRDSAYLQEEQAEDANRHRYSRHTPALPLYTVADAEEALKLVQARPYDTPFPVSKDVQVTYRPAGHIMGSATVALDADHGAGKRIVFSGDLGRWDRPVLHDPARVPAADVLLCESTYGDRVHAADAMEDLARIVGQVAQRSGAMVVPAFAVGRTQELVYQLRELEERGDIPVLPVYVDSPMAISVTDIYRRHTDEHDVAMERLLNSGGSPFETRQFHLARTPDESKQINRLQGPFIVISSSGMATGGRVLHHLRNRLDDKRTTILLIGFQAAGTRGRALQEGARRLRMFGQEIKVRARVERLDGLSAHADREEIFRWLRGFERPPRQTYLVHGEPGVAHSLADTMAKRLGWTARPAEDRETVEV